MYSDFCYLLNEHAFDECILRDHPFLQQNNDILNTCCSAGKLSMYHLQTECYHVMHQNNPMNADDDC